MVYCGLLHSYFVNLSQSKRVVCIMTMYSTFKYLLSPRYEFHSPVCVISDSEMKMLELHVHQLELDAILDQRKRLDEAYERQNQWFAERECAIKKEIKALSPSASEMLKDKARRAVEGVKETVKKAVDAVPNF